ncbi:MAG: hypothetical protein KFB96_22045 [Thiocapsa sp.]|uniref:hypothetical protein n=1 Tax=Thiocapsa sp. TaxID=2024551 RepID=UPI001BCB97B0|nr:hypothetical protein [Thiocapsa sp.]QVL48272.1 MAG: hypothetical protein KFB96_22045 [Thiocapsa sp.]
MDRLHDPAVLALPHPVRVDAALGVPIEASLLGGDALRERLRPLFLDPSVTSSWLLRNVPELARLAGLQMNAPASYNLGTFLLLLARARLRVHGDPILAVAPALQRLLGATDLTEGLPVRFFRAPYTSVYIAFPRPCALKVYNRATDLHELEGAYVGSHEVPPHHVLHERKTRGAALRLDPARPTRVIELIFTGSPIGKRYALDDASQDVTLFIQDEDECLSAMLARHNAYYAAPRGEDAGVLPPLPVEIACATAAISELAKVLLYLNLPDAEKRRVTERTDLEKRLRGLGPKKAAKIGRKLTTAYDRILIGPSAEPDWAGSGAPGGLPRGDDRHVKPHWRRGHFRRIRYGEGLAESRLGWIQPVLVNAGELTGAGSSAVKTKPYVVR